MSNLAMGKFEKRRIALSALAENIGIGANKAIAQKVSEVAGRPISESYVSRLKYPPGKAGKKNIGDDWVEYLDSAFLGWLDQDHGTPDPGSVAGLLAQIAPILDSAPKELRDAVLSLALKYQKDPADGARIVAAIRALVPDDPGA